MTRQEQSIKISELPSSVSFNGLWTLGYQINGGKKTSVKVSLDEIQTAQENAVAAATAAREAATEANTAAGNVKDGKDGIDGKDGKTVQFSIGTVESGISPSATLTDDGVDNSGNPKKKLNFVFPKGADGKEGKTPVFETGSVSTGNPGTSAYAEIEYAGTTDEGSPLYKINLTLPRGQQGLPGEGSGNVSASGNGLAIGKKYLFVPNSDGSTSGKFVEYVEPAVPSNTSDLENDSGYTTSTAVAELLAGYVQKVAGKGLSTEDFTTELKNKLNGLSDYDDTNIQSALTSLQNQFNTLLSGNASVAIESFNEIIAFLANVEDTETLEGIIAGINTTIANVQASIPTKISQLTNDDHTVKDASYVHTDNNYTTEEKEKLAGISSGGSLNEYIITISTADKQLFKAGAAAIDQAAAETFLGPIDDLLAAVDSGKKIYIRNTEAKTLTELKVLFRDSNFTSFFSRWALSASHVVDLRTVINSVKKVHNQGIRYGYLINTDDTIIAGGGVQEQYSLSGDITLTVKPDTFKPEYGCVTTVMVSTLNDSAANVTIAADSTLEGKFSVIGDNPIAIPANSVVELSVLFIKAYQTDMYVIRYSEPYTRPS